jgi:hypothetical protein
MLTLAVPKNTNPNVLLFLQGWSACMASMMQMTEADKRQVEKIFKEHIEPTAACQELKILDAALITYLLHKCEAREHVGSEKPKGNA